jgi:hypothetical protein
MIRAACHCGGVRFEIAEPPAWVMDCNCTVCRRYGALWTYFEGDDQTKLLMTPDKDATATYMWGERALAFHFCKTCGCVTHWEAMPPYAQLILGINARMMAGLDPSTVTVRRLDNSHSGFFWTRPDEPVTPGRHPPMPPPGFEDWR